MSRTLLSLALIASVCGLSLPAGAVDNGQTIIDNMAKLGSMVGTWKGVATFHEKDGTTGYDLGDYNIHYVLEGTYLEQEVTLRDKDDPTRHHSFLVFITYNPETKKYDSTYFYSRWAIRVSESGEFDEATKEFRTTAFIPREDGTRDENVHTVTKLGKAGELIYQHYSRYSDEQAERMNMEVSLRRVG